MNGVMVFVVPSFLVEADALESGSIRGFLLLKGSRFFPQLPEACSGPEIGPKRSFGAICWFP